MTREEAIDILFGVIAANSEEENEALDMAIEALEAQTDGDLISRADLFNELATVKASPEANEYKAEVYGVIQKLPSAEPKTGRDCTDFVNWLLDEIMDEEMWELNAVANGEVIARKLKKLGLLEVKDGYYVRTQSAEAEPNLMEDGTLVVNVPDARLVKRVLISDEKNWGGLYYSDEEPKTGEWVRLEREENVYDRHGVPTWGVNYMCDKCGFITTAIQDHFGQYKWCPSCGADMRGEEE